jgi:V/A-type H+-transporting ATPase subunit D
MARVPLSKSSLTQQQRQLKTFRQFLPSLDLKRRQLIAERAKAQSEVAEREAAIARLRDEIGHELPMAANRDVDLDRLVTVRAVEVGEQNVVGVRLPVLASVGFDARAYSFLSKPHWVDRAAVCLRELLEQELRLEVARRRLTILEAAVTTVTQRVNLFDKVLEGVVRAKIAKRKTAARAAHARVAEL